MKTICTYSIVGVLLILLGQQHLSVSQPVLKLVRPHFVSPTTIYFDLFCRDSLRFNVSKSNIRLIVRGRRITDYELLCPNLNVRCCANMVLLYDRFVKTEMDAIAFLKAKEMGKVIIDQMDTLCDQARVVSTGRTSTLDVPRTGEKKILSSSIDKITPSDTSNLAEAIDDALDRFDGDSASHVSAIVVFAGSNFVLSDSQIDSLIMKALQKHIQIFTIKCLEEEIDEKLYRLAMDTGGTQFMCQSSAMVQLYGNMCTFIGPGIQFANCSIQFPDTCYDGRKHTITVTIDSLPGCPGSVTDSTFYMTGSMTTKSYVVDVQDTTIFAKPEVDLRLTIDRALHRPFEATSFRLEYDTTCLRFADVWTDSTLLTGINVSTQSVMNGVVLTTSDSRFLDTTGTLMRLKFHILNPTSRRECVIWIRDWKLELDCEEYLPGLGVVRIKQNTTIVSPSIKPIKLTLSQNYPNPFSESTTILLPLLLGEGWGEVEDSPMRSEVVAFKFYDLFGREVLDLSDEARSNSSVTVRASQLPCAGMYFYRLSFGNQSYSKLMIFTK